MKTIYRITYIDENKEEKHLIEAKLGSLAKIWCYHKEKYNTVKRGKFIHLYEHMRSNPLSNYKIYELEKTDENIQEKLIHYMNNYNTFYPNGFNLEKVKIENVISYEKNHLNVNENIIYKIEGPTNSEHKKIFIGSGKEQLNVIWGRFKFNYTKVKSEEYKYLYKAFSDFNTDVFKITYLDKISNIELSNKLKFYIQDLNSLYPSGYNTNITYTKFSGDISIEDVDEKYENTMIYNKQHLNENNPGIIYKIVGPTNLPELSKTYIGQTRTSLENRFNGHKKENIGYLHHAMKEYGNDNFVISLVEDISTDIMDEKETYYINTYNTIFPNGYNTRPGVKAGYHVIQYSPLKKDLPKYISYFQYKADKNRNRKPRHGYNIMHHPSGKRKTITIPIDQDLTPELLEKAKKYLSVLIKNHQDSVNQN